MSYSRRVGRAALLVAAFGVAGTVTGGVGVAAAGPDDPADAAGAHAPAAKPGMGGPRRHASRPSEARIRPAAAKTRAPAAMAPAASSVPAAAASQAPTPQTVLDDAANWLKRTFDNSSPVLAPKRVGISLDPGQTRSIDLGASDPDGDQLTYAVSSTRPGASTGTLLVAADGSATYTPPPTWNGLTPYTDTYTVTVSDVGSGWHVHGLPGLLNLMTFGLVGAAGDRVTGIVSVRVDPATPQTSDPPVPGPSTFCGCTLMPADTIFHADIRGLAVRPESDTWLDVLGANRGATLRAGWGGGPWMGSTGGMPVNIVSATHPTELVVFNRGYSTSGPSIDDTPYAIPDRPLVEGMPDIPAWDRHLLVFQEGTCISQELYNVANGVELPANSIPDALGNAVYAALYGSSWVAEAGVQVDMSSPLYPDRGWANASRLPYLPLILRPDELDSGHIDHMMGIAIAKDRGTGYTWPARSGDGTGTNPDGVPMGTVFRLRADFDISAYSLPTQVILRGLQEHGAVVFDSGSPGADGAGLLGMSNGWTGTDRQTAQGELNTVPLAAFEAVDVLTLAADPAAGWQIVVPTS